MRRTPTTLRRLIAALTAACLLLALAAPAALAANDGRGFYGETDDKVVTNTGFIVIAFFPLLIFMLSMLQWRLDKRKDARKKAAKRRLGDPRWRGGW